jgi:2-dehydropantoate 2-reductase
MPSDAGPWDWALVTTKSFDTAAAAHALLPLLPHIGFCISLQNGLGNIETIAGVAGWEKTLGGRVITGVEVPRPGRIQVTVHADDIRLGHLQHRIPLAVLGEIAAIWRVARIPTTATDELEQYIWAKVLYNAALNPLGALLGATYGQLADNEAARAIMDEIIQEAFSVVVAHNVRLFWRDAGAFCRIFYGEMIPATRDHHPSMLRDLERGRRTEIDALNGAIVRLGEEKALPVPANRLIVKLVRYRESMGAGRAASS